MTAEVVIMNKRALALATDSTVTIGKHSKFHNSVNKLFQLSKYHPVGIMIFSNAEFMGVPWEIIIKQYRRIIKKEAYKTLEDYCNKFFEYINSDKLNFKDYESKYIYQITNLLVNEVKFKISDKIREMISELNRQLEEEEMNKIYNDVIVYYENTIISNAKDLEGLPVNHREYIKEKYECAIKRIIEENLDLNFIEEDSLNAIMTTVINILCKKIFKSARTGVVIAGYGKSDIFPKLFQYDVEGQINGFTKYCEIKKREISNSNECWIIPFAQTDTVQTFIRGISPSYSKIIKEYLKNNVIEEMGPDEEYEISDKAKEYLKTKLESIDNIIQSYSQEEYINPIIRAVPTLPIEELASMAESLVNITSFRRQVCIDDNMLTVGGPIDVAVISKGDGFIWIKRKHYFEATYNQQFFNNYYDDEE